MNMNTLLQSKKFKIVITIIIISFAIIALLLFNKKKTDIISITTPELENLEEIKNEYNLYSQIASLEGTINDDLTKRIRVSIKSGNLDILNKELDIIDNKWKLDEISLIPGSNEVSFETYDKKGNLHSQSIFINNYEIKNLGSIDSGDNDWDGLKNYEEIILGTDQNRKDSDNDGLNDYEEVYITLTSPLSFDTDENGINDIDEDFDNDGLSNAIEIKKNTNPYLSDTDDDGLSDYEELNTYGTSATKADSDGDGYNDKDEIFDLKTDPKKYAKYIELSKTSEDKKATIYNEKASPELYYRTTIEENTYLTNGIKGALSKAYDVKIDVEKSNVKLSFDISNIEEETELAILSYDSESQLLNEETLIENEPASINVNKSGTYILIDKSKYVDDTYKADETEIKDNLNNKDLVFVIDISKSMDDNDPYDYRKQFMSNYISTMSSDDRVAVVLFRRDARILNKGFAKEESDKRKLITDVFNISNDDGYNFFYSGTDGSLGLYTAINMFPKVTSARKYIIFLTDGEDTHKSYDYSYIEELAAKEKITILTMGLGEEIDTVVLNETAEKTGGKSYIFNLAQNISDNSEDIKNEINDKYIDSNNDGISDYITKKIASGEIKMSNGKNPFEGMTYEQIQENGDLDNDGLKNGSEIVVSSNGEKIYLKYISNPLVKDTDGDGISDKDDASPTEAFNPNFLVVNGLSYTPPTPIEDKFEQESNSAYNTEKNCDVKGIIDRADFQANLFGSMPAARALRYFLSNNGKPYNFGTDWGLLETYRGKENLAKNTNSLIDVVESSVKEKSKVSFATNVELTGTNFLTHLEDLADIGWAYAVGHTRAIMVAEAKNNGNNKYEMELHYYIVDYYDWKKDAGLIEGFGGLVNDSEMYKLHACGKAKQFRISIKYKMNITWTKGNRYYLNKIALWDTPSTMKVTKIN